MIIKELRNYETPKIKSMVIQLKSSILEYRFKLAQGELTNTSDIKKSRRVIAQLLTILKERGERITFDDWKGYGNLLNKNKENEDKPKEKKVKGKKVEVSDGSETKAKTKSSKTKSKSKA